MINEKTVDGHPIQGYLVHPVNEKPGTRYPIIIASYGFFGHYIADAEWHSSFPAQSLAAEGYLVFLLNPWGSGQMCTDGYQRAQELEGWNKLSMVEGAIDFLAQKGGDLNKVGIYGWSHGAFVVNFMLTHSNKIHAACLGEGGDYSIANFWLTGEPTWQGIYDNTFGGPPWGETLINYLHFSPFFNLDKVKAPLLLEFAGVNGVLGLEMYSSLRYLGIPAELVVYKDEEHNFVKPKARSLL